jgi:hypothetical protein
VLGGTVVLAGMVATGKSGDNYDGWASYALLAPFALLGLILVVLTTDRRST